MTINLSDYTNKIRDSLKRGGFACVYVARAGACCRLGFATDLVQAITRLQRSCPVTVEIEDVLWVPDRRKAENIVAIVQDRLPGNRGSGWFDVESDKAADELSLTAFMLYPEASMVRHVELIGQWKAGRVKEAVA